MPADRLTRADVEQFLRVAGNHAAIRDLAPPSEERSASALEYTQLCVSLAPLLARELIRAWDTEATDAR